MGLWYIVVMCKGKGKGEECVTDAFFAFTGTSR